MRKKLFAVIMSIMMMVTFMPTMAFAIPGEAWYVSDITWNFGSQVTATIKYRLEDDLKSELLTTTIDSVKKTFITKDNCTELDKTEDFAGLVMAKLPRTLYGGDVYLVPPAYSVPTEAYYYDFNGAKIVNLNESGKKEVPMEIDADKYCKMINQSSTLKEPTLKAGYVLGDILGDYVKFVDPTAPAGTANPDTAYVQYIDRNPANGYGKYTSPIGGPIQILNHEILNDIGMAAVIATPTLPRYEKYQENQNYDVKVSFDKHPLYDQVMASILDSLGSEFGIINLDKVVTDYQTYIYSNTAGSVELKMDSMSASKRLPLYSSMPSLNVIGPASDDLEEMLISSLMLGFYNGADQNLHATTQGVTVEYSTDLGKTFSATAPALKEATTSYLGLLMEYVELIEEIAELGDDADGNMSVVLANPILKELLDDIVYVKVTKGTAAPKYGLLLPMVLPREFIVEYKNSQLNFAPGKNITTNDVLEAKAITGYEAISGLVDPIIDIAVNDGTSYGDLIAPAVGLLGVDKSGFCDADKAYAEKFVEKYFVPKDMPTAGTGNKVEFAKNVKIDINALIADMKTDPELLVFLNNYDILPELMMLDLSSLGDIPLDVEGDLVAIMEMIDPGVVPAIDSGDVTLGTDAVKLLKSLLGLVKTDVLSTATVNFDKEFTQITAKNLTKTFHVKKAKALAKKKTFKYKATTDYGTLEYKKLSGNKKITVRDDGKVTVKKGLKKGTYTVRVKVSVPEAGKYVKKSIKVKIKK